MDENVSSGAPIEDENGFEDWSDIDVSALTEDDPDGDDAPEAAEDDGGGADRPDDGAEAEAKGEEAAEDGTDGEQKADGKGTDQSFELKHLDEVRTVGRDEVIALAQKGLDYDRIRGKLEELRGLEAQASENGAFAEFVQELAQNAGVSPEVLMDTTRAKILMGKQQGLSQEDALQQVKAAREARSKTDQQSKDARDARNRQEHFREEVARFRTMHPDVRAEDIADEVWQDYDKSGNLTDAWQNAENRRLAAENADLRKELDALKQDRKNTERSTGSRKTAGAGKHSAVDDAWEAALKSW